MTQAPVYSIKTKKLVLQEKARREKERRENERLFGLNEHEQRTRETEEREKEKCKKSVAYFLQNYCFIYDTTEADEAAPDEDADAAEETVDNSVITGGRWVKFDLWQAQLNVLNIFQRERRVVVLKARQLGLTWLALGYALHKLCFRPNSTILVYSLRDTEAKAMLGEKKLFGMLKRLPEFLKPTFRKKNEHSWEFENDSTIHALPATAGDSYTATDAIIDEADLIPKLNDTLQRVQPTIDAGGKLILLSRSNKKLPNSHFKNIYRAAKRQENSFKPVFLAWHERPDRSLEWYEEQRRLSLSTTNALDNLYESYPATDAEALAPATLDKRIPFDWLNKVYSEAKPLPPELTPNAPSIPGLRIFKVPERGKEYRIGGDPAEGNPTSDDSAGVVVEVESGEQVACFNGKFEPSTFAAYCVALSEYYFYAPLLIERNNHGHAVLLALKTKRAQVLQGLDDKDGWLDNERGKVTLYNSTADSVMTQDCFIRDFETFNQLSMIDGNTLNAPQGENDDLADAFSLANKARQLTMKGIGFAVLAQTKTKGWQ